MIQTYGICVPISKDERLTGISLKQSTQVMKVSRGSTSTSSHTILRFDSAWDFIHRLLETDPKKRMSLTDALQHPWLASYSNSDAMNVSHTTPEPRTVSPDSSTLSPVPGSFSAPTDGPHISPSQQANRALAVDLFPKENRNLGLNRLTLSPNKTKSHEPEPSTSAMPGASSRGSGNPGRPLQRCALVFARQNQEMAEVSREDTD